MAAEIAKRSVDPAIVALVEKYSDDEPRDKQGQWTAGGMSAGEKASVKVYGGPRYHDINHGLRHGSLGGDLKGHVSNLDKVMARSATPKDMKVWRVYTPQQFKSLGIGTLKQGESFTDRGFSSTTTSPDKIASDLKGAIKVQVVVPKGYPAIKLGGAATIEQHEITLDRDTTFKIKEPQKYYTSGGKQVKSDDPILLEVVPKTKKAFDPDEARDEHGMWTSGGSAGGVTGFHGASAKILSSVRKNGLTPGGDKKVWLSNNDQTAALFGGFKGGKTLVFEVHVPQAEMGKFSTIAQGAANATGSLDHAIPPEWIAGYHEVSTVPNPDKPGKIKDVLGPLKPLRKSDHVVMYVAVPCDDVEKYSDDEPRDDHGRWTTGGGMGTAGSRQKKAWIKARAPMTIQDNMRNAIGNQRTLGAAGSEIAQKHGVEFVDPGVKANQSRIEEKAKTRGANGITDYTRGSFVIDSPEKADAIMRDLHTHFPDGVIDEGWQVTPVNYLNRTAMVRYADGSVGEIQVTSKEMSAALSPAGGNGHQMYYFSRSLPQGSALKQVWEARQSALYSKALNSSGQSWNAVAGRAIRTVAKALLYASSVMVRPSMPTSEESTLIHSLLTKAQASPAVQRAGTT